MDSIFLICYGESEEHVKISFDNKLIGANNTVNIPEGQLIYLLIKRNGIWNVVGRGNIDSISGDNPFKQPNRFKTYKISNLTACQPFAISEICKKELGNNYGLVLRTPRKISAKGFIKYLDEHFKDLH